MIRLFIGIALPDELRARLAAMAAGIPGAKWVAPNNLHLTLRFIGEVEETLLEDIDAALARIRSPAFDLTFSDVGKFESGRKPHTLWIGVAKCPPLERLQPKIEAALVRLGIRPESRKFAAHVTLARLRNASAGRVAAFISAHSLFRHGPVPVDRFTLYSSQLGKGGSVYRVEAEYPLDRVSVGTDSA
jgi:2'-5' RNA ligase